MNVSDILKVVIIGPESTGKSTLCQMLAQHYGTTWCPEFAREYLLTHGTNYTFDDLAYIAKGQLALEEEYAYNLAQQWQPLPDGKWINVHTNTVQLHKPLLFIDTDMYVMKVWCEYVFKQCHPFILNTIAQRHYHLYLLCNIDLPWVKDELREYPNEEPRKELFHMYKDIMLNQTTPWQLISGTNEQRLAVAINAVNAFIQQH